MVIIDGMIEEAIREWVSDCAWEAGYAQGGGHYLGVYILPKTNLFRKYNWL
jgi:hypothetical protein